MRCFLRLRRRRERCAMSCPPRRSFVAGDDRRRGQLGTVINCRRSTYSPASGVQTIGATSLRPIVAETSLIRIRSAIPLLRAEAR
jgi:hypothetical protein